MSDSIVIGFIIELFIIFMAGFIFGATAALVYHYRAYKRFRKVKR